MDMKDEIIEWDLWDDGIGPDKKLSGYLGITRTEPVEGLIIAHHTCLKHVFISKGRCHFLCLFPAWDSMDFETVYNHTADHKCLKLNDI